jgi:uncharacterized membrane protein
MVPGYLRAYFVPQVLPYGVFGTLVMSWSNLKVVDNLKREEKRWVLLKAMVVVLSFVLVIGIYVNDLFLSEK